VSSGWTKDPPATTVRGIGFVPPGLPSTLPTVGLPTPAPPAASGCPTPASVPASPSRSTAGRPERHVACSGPEIALTLDDGPSPEWTPRMLTLLDGFGVKATFSVIGRQAVAHPGLVNEVVGAGHLVGNHTQTHPDLQRLTAGAVQREIGAASAAIERACGRRPVLFRAPGGSWSPTVLAICAQQGLRPLYWSVDPRDWSRPGTRKIAEVLLGRTRPGSIVLAHDGGGDRSQTYQALAIAIPRLLQAGYRFVQP